MVKYNLCKKYLIIVIMIIAININLINNIFNFPKYSSINNKIYNYYGNTDYNIIYDGQKLLWNNETSLGEDKVKKELEEFKNIKLSFNNANDFVKRENPSISLVITLYNQEKYIKYIYSSIQKQTLKNLEIIFVDDDSKDNSQKMINYLMERDKRIVYLKNNFNRKAFYSRNRGILHAKGKYIIVIDPDDLLVTE